MPDNSQPAFPTGVVQRGMSLRQWYAGMVVQGLLANPAYTDELGKWYTQSGEMQPNLFAEHAWSLADAMLATENE